MKVVLGLQSLLPVLHLSMFFLNLRIATMRKTHVSTHSSKGTSWRPTYCRLSKSPQQNALRLPLGTGFCLQNSTRVCVCPTPSTIRCVLCQTVRSRRICITNLRILHHAYCKAWQLNLNYDPWNENKGNEQGGRGAELWRISSSVRSQKKITMHFLSRIYSLLYWFYDRNFLSVK